MATEPWSWPVGSTTSWSRATAANYQGIGYNAAARYEEGLVRLSEAIDGIREGRRSLRAEPGPFPQGLLSFRAGEPRRGHRRSPMDLRGQRRLGDSRTLCSSYLWARATRGNIPFEELRSCYPCRPDDVMSTVHGLMAEGHWHTFHGRTAEALLAFERAGAMVRTSLCVNAHTILALPNLAGALRRHADAVADRDARQSDQLRRRADRLARWATRIAHVFPAAYPVALRERSLILAACGRSKKALKFADRSCAVAKAQKARLEYCAVLARARDHRATARLARGGRTDPHGRGGARGDRTADPDGHLAGGLAGLPMAVLILESSMPLRVDTSDREAIPCEFPASEYGA